ncbi:MAG TPA: dihydrofolate reductase family protein [Gaiellaceae bacterium]|nr:dihydrofolate reductase family protein [Gaiellaceae bacterium]
MANFVQTLDGVVAIPGVPRSNALIAGESAADRFVMGLLRACADVVLVGSGTLRSSPLGTWRADRVFPPVARDFGELRHRRGRPDHPAVAILTAGGSFDPSHPVLERGALVLSTTGAAPSLRAAVSSTTEVIAVDDGDTVDVRAAVELLHDRGHRVVLSEGGPGLLGSLLAARLVDELFLTLSPLVAGRALEPRLSLVEGIELLPDVRLGGTLRSVRRSGDHLLLRYAL